MEFLFELTADIAEVFLEKFIDFFAEKINSAKVKKKKVHN